MNYLYLLFSGVALTSKLGVIISWLTIPLITLCLFLLKKPVVHRKNFLIASFGVFIISMAGLSGYFLDIYNSRVINNVCLSLIGMFMAVMFYKDNSIKEGANKFLI